MANIFDLQATISLNAANFENGIQQAQTAFSGLGSKIDAGAIALGNVVAAGATKAAGAVVDFAKDSVASGMSFEAGMSQIAATLGMTTDDIANNVNGAGDTFDALKKKAAEMGRSTNFSASQAAEGLNILAMSGFDAEQSIGMIEDVLHLAAAGSMEMGSAAGYISGAMKGFADETKDSGYYADLMAKGATLANTSVSQLGEAMSAGAAGAASYSQSAESMTVALLRLAEQSVVGSAAGTALAAAMKDIYTPTDQAAKALAELGVSAYENGKALDFNDIVNNLSDALAGYSEEEANAYKQTIFGIQGLNAFNKMTVTGVETQARWADALSGASDGLGEAAKQYDTMTSNLQGAKDSLNSALEGLQNAVYEKLSGPLTEAAHIATDALGAITEGFEADGIRGAVTSFGGLVKTAFDDVVTSVTSVESPLTRLFDAFETASGGAISTFTGAIAEFAGTVASVSAETVQSIAAGVRSFIGAFDSAEVSGIIGTIAGAASNLFSALMSIQSSVIEDLGSAIQTFLGSFDYEGAAGAISSIATKAAELFGAFSNAVAERIRAIAERFSGFATKIAELATQFPVDFGKIGGAISGIIGTLTDFAVKAEEATRPIREFFGSALATLFQGAVGVVVGAAGGIINALADVVNFINDVFRAGIALLSGDFTGAAESIKSAWGNIGAFFADIWQAIKGAFAGVKEAFGDIGRNIVEGLKDGILGAWSSFTSWLGEKCSSIVDGVKGFFGIHSPSRVFAGIGENLVAGLAQGWSSEFGDLERTVGGDIADLTGTAKVGFESSALGRSSAAQINSFMAGQSSGGTMEINLVLDGDVAATALYDPLRRVAWQKGKGEPAYA